MQHFNFENEIFLLPVSFNDLITFPPIVFTYLASFIAIMEAVNILEVISEPGDTMINGIQTGVTSIIRYTISATERGASYYCTDPSVGHVELALRYDNIANFLIKIDQVFYLIENHIAILDNNPQTEDAFNWFSTESERLRLATNQLLKVLRTSEDLLRIYDPDFVPIPKQWFE